MNRLAYAFAAILPLAACASMEAPTVANYDADSVTIRSLSGTASNDPKVFAEAERVCGMTGKHAQLLGADRAAVANSTLTYAMGVPVYPNDFVFACI